MLIYLVVLFRPRYFMEVAIKILTPNKNNRPPPYNLDNASKFREISVRARRCATMIGRAVGGRNTVEARWQVPSMRMMRMEVRLPRAHHRIIPSSSCFRGRIILFAAARGS